MNDIEAFVRLYHVWGILGAITAWIYGAAAFQIWRQAGGTFRNAPADVIGGIRSFTVNSLADVWSLLRWTLSGFLGSAFSVFRYQWPKGEMPAYRYGLGHTLRLGIALGGTARLLTALYWAERNTEWMNHVSVWVPAVPILYAIAGDLAHHSTAWPRHQYRVRMLAIFSILYVGTGLLV